MPNGRHASHAAYKICVVSHEAETPHAASYVRDRPAATLHSDEAYGDIELGAGPTEMDLEHEEAIPEGSFLFTMYTYTHKKKTTKFAFFEFYYNNQSYGKHKQ